MRKRIVRSASDQPVTDQDHGWLDLQQIATVEVTSEDPSFPIESIFGYEEGSGWRAGQAGEQHIRIIFDEPQKLQRIRLVFQEADRERTQEFTLRWSPSSGGEAKEIMRQRWNFSPHGSTTEVEDYAVDLEAVSALELVIQPDVSRGDAVASLASWHVR